MKRKVSWDEKGVDFGSFAQPSLSHPGPVASLPCAVKLPADQGGEAKKGKGRDGATTARGPATETFEGQGHLLAQELKDVQSLRLGVDLFFFYHQRSPRNPCRVRWLRVRGFAGGSQEH